MQPNRSPRNECFCGTIQLHSAVPGPACRGFTGALPTDRPPDRLAAWLTDWWTNGRERLSNARPQVHTTQLLAHLMRGCSPPSASLFSALLDLGDHINWSSFDPAYKQLAVELATTLCEAAKSGHLSAPDAPLGSKAGVVAHRWLAMNCAPPHSLAPTSSIVCVCLWQRLSHNTPAMQ
jgi:hypothetical protein